MGLGRIVCLDNFAANSRSLPQACSQLFAFICVASVRLWVRASACTL